MTDSVKNKTLIRSGIERIWNDNDLGAVDEVTHRDYVGHMPGDKTINGIDGFKAALGQFKQAFPDATMTIEAQVAEGDEVITTMMIEGTQTGRFESEDGVIEPTGNRICARQVSRMKVRDGKVVEEWVTWDESVALSQLAVETPRINL